MRNSHVNFSDCYRAHREIPQNTEVTRKLIEPPVKAVRQKRLEPQRNPPGDVEFVQIVTVPNCPATAPDWITPISAVSSSQVSWSPPELTSETEVPTNVVFRPPAQRVGKPCRSADATYARVECIRTETKKDKGAHPRLFRGKMKQKIAHVLVLVQRKEFEA